MPDRRSYIRAYDIENWKRRLWGRPLGVLASELRTQARLNTVRRTFAFDKRWATYTAGETMREN